MKPEDYFTLLAAIVIAPQLNTAFAWVLFVLLACLAAWLGKGR